VTKWKYNPKIVDGRSVARMGVESKITFRLTDERGKIIPE
jgi:protein TonB